MRVFLLTENGTPVGEAVEYSDGTVNVRWLEHDADSRFASVDALMAAVPTYEIAPVEDESLADKLRKKRRAAGLSQRALAKQLGMSFSTISRIEAGKNFVVNGSLEAWLKDE